VSNPKERGHAALYSRERHTKRRGKERIGPEKGGKTSGKLSRKGGGGRQPAGREKRQNNKTIRTERAVKGDKWTIPLKEDTGAVKGYRRGGQKRG